MSTQNKTLPSLITTDYLKSAVRIFSAKRMVFLDEPELKKTEEIVSKNPIDANIENLKNKSNIEIKTHIEKGELKKEIAEQKLIKDDLQSINNNGIPLPKVEKIKKNKKPIKLKEIINALNEGNFDKFVELLIRLCLGTENVVKGVGLQCKGLEKIDNSKKTAVFSKIENINKNNIDRQEKLKLSFLQTQTKYSLYREGYELDRIVGNDSGNSEYTIEKIDNNTHLKDCINPEIWKKIKDKNVVGPLAYNGTLKATPKNPLYLYLDKEGYPIFISQNENEKPKVAIFKKADPDKQGEMAEATKLDFLKTNLKPGDILLLNAGEKKEGGGRLFNNLVAMLQSDNLEDENNFPLVHAAVYLGNGRIKDVRSQGTREITLADLGEQYSGISVCRSKDPQKIIDFAKNTNYDGYDVERILKKTQNKINNNQSYFGDTVNSLVKIINPMIKKDQKNKGICTDYASKSGVEELEGKETAPQIFDAIDVVYSMEID